MHSKSSTFREYILAGALLFGVACSAEVKTPLQSGAVSGSASDGSAGAGTGETNGATSGSGAWEPVFSSSGSSGFSGSSGPPASTEPDEDGDGFRVEEGDCDDTVAQINPGAYDFPGNDLDEDCSQGDASAQETSCDLGLVLDSNDPNDALRAIDLCQFTTPDSDRWGVISVSYTDASGAGAPDSPLQHGLLPGFGVATPRKGANMLALSSGIARAPDQPGFTNDCDLFSTSFFGPPSTEPPPGYPKDPPSCQANDIWNIFFPGDIIYNAAALSVKIRVPTNAKSLSFDSTFYTYEYPDYICSEFNDFYVVMMEPQLPDLPDANIAFDQDGNPISVNNSYFQVCEPGEHNGRTFTCPLGTSDLIDTGFEATSQCASGGTPGATGWLVTTVPVQGGSIIELRFAIWDTGDAILDSTVLIDNFTWSLEEVDIPETIPVIVE